MRALIGVLAVGGLLWPAGALTDFEQMLDNVEAQLRQLGF